MPRHPSRPAVFLRRRSTSAMVLSGLLLFPLELAAFQDPQDPPEPPPAPAAQAPPLDSEAVEEAAEEAAIEAAEEAREAAEDALEEELDALEDRLDELEEAVEDSELSDLEARDLRQRRREIQRARDRVRRHLRRESGRDSKVAFGSDIRLEAGELGNDLVAIGGSVYVEGDVRGDVVAVGGGAHIDGEVTGDVVAVGGRVVLGDEAAVLGHVTSVGSRVERSPGARVRGDVNEVDFGSDFTIDLFDNIDFFGDGEWFRVGRAIELMWGISGLVMLLLLCSLVLLVAGPTVENVRRRAAATPWLAGVVGLAVQLFFLPVLTVVIIILAISIIGIPLLILVPFVVLGLLLVFLVGFTGAVLAVGRWSERRFGWSFTSPFVALVVGLLVIQGFSLAGDALSVAGSFLTIFAMMFGLVGFIIKYVAWTVGLGAAFLGVVGYTPASGAAAAPGPGGGETPLPPLPDAEPGGDAPAAGDAPGASEEPSPSPKA